MSLTCAINIREPVLNACFVSDVAKLALSKLVTITLILFCCLGVTSNASAQEANDLSFDDLVFEMEEDEVFDREMLTEEINSYNGTIIRLRGFIRPTTRKDGITKFIFVRDNKECCFGPGAALFDCVLVRLAEDETTQYTVRPITIRGEFLISEYSDRRGQIWAVYRMKNAFVE